MTYDELLDEQLALEEEIAIDRARVNFESFVRYVNPDHHINWHHQLICRELQRLADGDNNRLIVTCPPRVGKACADEVDVLTSNGWTNHGNLCVGQEVMHPSGAWVKINAISEACLVDREVIINTGAKIVVHANHEWRVKLWLEGGVQWRTLCTQSIMDMLAINAKLSFKLPAVQKNNAVPGTSNFVKIIGVRRVSPRIGRCIEVDSPDGLYVVGRELTPTHNSELISRHFPAWLLGIKPDESIIASSYATPLAQRMSRDVQRIIDSPDYEKVFPGTKLSGKNIRAVAHGNYLRNSDIFEVVNRKGVYRGCGLQAGLTGMGAHTLLCDDFLKDAAAAMSKTILDNQWEWYSSVFRTRLAKGGRIAIVATRWSHDDLIGRLIDLAKSSEVADQWRVIKLPAINEEGPSEDDHREPGEALWPDFFPRKELESIRATNSRQFESLYQCNPVPMSGNIVNVSWFREYQAAQLPEKFEKVIISGDLTFKGAANSDWVVFCVVGLHNGAAYFLDMVRRQMPFTEQIQSLLELYHRTQEKYPVREVVIEDAANGAALVNVLRSKIPSLIALPVGRASKEARAQAVTPIIEAGNVFLPCPTKAAWVQAFLTEWAQFPAGAHDDIVDSSVWALTRLFPPQRMRTGVMPQLLGRAHIPSFMAGA